MNENKLITANVSFEVDGQPGQIKISALDFQTVVRRILTFDLESKIGKVTGFTLDDGRKFNFNSYVVHSWLDHGRIGEEKFIEMSLIK
ncbi:MAG: hypothetical protein JNL03_07125 [Prolixibacteraceae bacterium]|nr:hypothetical protein [Prolixibacteraceae bacterium]